MRAIQKLCMRHVALLTAMLFMMMPTSYAQAVRTPEGPDYRTIEISSAGALTNTERRVREAAVKVQTPMGGHGSGSLIKYRDLQLVLTAQHVAMGPIGSMYEINSGSRTNIGILIYSDQIHDIAMIWLPEKFEGVTPMRWNPVESTPGVMTGITYSGYPSFHSLMTYRGLVAGYEFLDCCGSQIMLHTYAYFGSSGSVVYNGRGEIVGILWGIDADRMRGQVIEDMVWVSPIQNLDMELALQGLCTSLNNEPRACR